MDGIICVKLIDVIETCQNFLYQSNAIINILTVKKNWLCKCHQRLSKSFYWKDHFIRVDNPSLILCAFIYDGIHILLIWFIIVSLSEKIPSLNCIPKLRVRYLKYIAKVNFVGTRQGIMTEI